MAEPVFLKKQSGACVEQTFSGSRFNILLNLFIGGDETTSQRNFLSLIFGTKVRSQDDGIISRSTYGEDIESIPRQSRIYTYLRNKGQEVSVCPEVDHYEKDTIESVALNASFFISKTNKAVTTVDPTIKLDPIRLRVTPKVRITVKVKSEGNQLRSYYLTDNASFNSADKTITFLPHSTVHTTAKYWEIPMVGSHEYGHHIFNTLVKPEVTDQNNFHGCFSQNLTALPDFKAEQTNADQKRILSAFNEGFADLISYYSLGDDERTLKGVRCLQVSRDVGSSVFFDHQTKVFSMNNVTMFLSPSYYTDNNLGCEITDYREIHIIGAVFAHTADKIVSTLTNSKEDKLKSVLSWAKAVRNAKAELSAMTKESYMRKLFALFVESAALTTGKKIDGALCAAAEYSFPSVTHMIQDCQ